MSKQNHDELMIDWGNLPVGSVATFYLPDIPSRDILLLASRKYRTHRLVPIDEHTLKCDTGRISYLPIPFIDGNLPGMLTVDLPEGIKKGQVFKVVVRQVTDEPQKVLRVKDKVHMLNVRHIVGSFQLTIPVRDKLEMLTGQQRLLSNLRWIERAIPAGNRWTSVFGKYVSNVAARVDALGGNSGRVAPSASGQWKEAYRSCFLLSLITVLLIAVLVVGIGTQTGGVVLLCGIPVVTLLSGMVYLWRKKCRPTKCQLLRTLLAGLGIGLIILVLLALFWISATQLITTLIVSAGVVIVVAIVSWVKGCFRR
jgi:hypothetical protein